MALTVIKNANLALSFLLELCVLVALGYWGFQTGQGTIAKIGLGIGAPMVAVVVWALFGAPKSAWRLQGPCLPALFPLTRAFPYAILCNRYLMSV